MTAAEELRLIRAAQAGSAAAEEALLAQYEALVRRVAGEDEDARQEGRLGLLSAIRSFDPTRGACLWTHARYRIRARVARWRHNDRLILVPTARPVTAGPLAVSLSELVPDTEGVCLADVIPDPAAGPEERALLRDEARRKLARLTPEQREVILLRWWGCSDPEIARRWGVTKQAVGQQRQKAAARWLEEER